MRAVDARSTFLIMDIIFKLYSRDVDFLNNIECSLSNVCYILYENNINMNKKHFKMNKEVGMLLPKKELIQVE